MRNIKLIALNLIDRKQVTWSWEYDIFLVKI